MNLERFCYGPYGTFGRLIVGDLELWTVERPWQDNEPGVSCIPEGEYSLEPHNSKAHPNTWALVGDTVSHYADPNKPRSAILIHVGNTMADVIGCIAVGTGLNEHAWGITSSVKAMDALREEMAVGHPLVIKISQYAP